MMFNIKSSDMVCCNDCDDGDTCISKFKCEHFDPLTEICTHFKDTGICVRLNKGIFCKRIVVGCDNDYSDEGSVIPPEKMRGWEKIKYD